MAKSIFSLFFVFFLASNISAQTQKEINKLNKYWEEYYNTTDSKTKLGYPDSRKIQKLIRKYPNWAEIYSLNAWGLLHNAGISNYKFTDVSIKYGYGLIGTQYNNPLNRRLGNSYRKIKRNLTLAVNSGSDNWSDYFLLMNMIFYVEILNKPYKKSSIAGITEQFNQFKVLAEKVKQKGWYNDLFGFLECAVRYQYINKVAYNNHKECVKRQMEFSEWLGNSNLKKLDSVSLPKVHPYKKRYKGLSHSSYDKVSIRTEHKTYRKGEIVFPWITDRARKSLMHLYRKDIKLLKEINIPNWSRNHSTITIYQIANNLNSLDYILNRISQSEAFQIEKAIRSALANFEGNAFDKKYGDIMNMSNRIFSEVDKSGNNTYYGVLLLEFGHFRLGFKIAKAKYLSSYTEQGNLTDRTTFHYSLDKCIEEATIKTVFRKIENTFGQIGQIVENEADYLNLINGKKSKQKYGYAYTDGSCVIKEISRKIAFFRQMREIPVLSSKERKEQMQSLYGADCGCNVASTKVVKNAFTGSIQFHKLKLENGKEIQFKYSQDGGVYTTNLLDIANSDFDSYSDFVDHAIKDCLEVNGCK